MKKNVLGLQFKNRHTLKTEIKSLKSEFEKQQYTLNKYNNSESNFQNMLRHQKLSSN